MNLPVQHLSDEAVAAYADGMLATPAQARATRHLTQCPECSVAVADQRAAVCALRAAPVPALPAGLLERLRAVPVTTPLTPRAVALAPDGSAVFPAFGTSSAAIRPMSTAATATATPFHFPIAVPHLGRRAQQLAIVAAAAAMITVGMAASGAVTASGSGGSTNVGPGESNLQVISTVRRDGPQVQSVNAISGRR